MEYVRINIVLIFAQDNINLVMGVGQHIKTELMCITLKMQVKKL